MKEKRNAPVTGPIHGFDMDHPIPYRSLIVWALLGWLFTTMWVVGTLL